VLADSGWHVAGVGVIPARSRGCIALHAASLSSIVREE